LAGTRVFEEAEGSIVGETVTFGLTLTDGRGEEVTVIEVVIDGETLTTTVAVVVAVTVTVIVAFGVDVGTAVGVVMVV